MHTGPEIHRQLLAALKRLRDGNYDILLPYDLPGEQGGIARAINEAVEALALRSTELGANQLALETLGIGVWEYDPVTKTARWDDLMYRLFGMTPEQHPEPASVWMGLLAPEARDEVLGAMERAIEKGGDFKATYEIVTPLGGRRLIFVQGRVMLPSGEHGKKVFGIAHDRTEELLHQREKEALNVRLQTVLASAQKSERRFRSLFENSPVGISLIDKEGRFLALNPAYCQMLGYAEEELRELGVMPLLPPEIRPVLKDLLSDLMRDEADVPLQEVTLLHRSGRPVLVRITSRSTIDHNGDSVLISLLEDISEVKRQEGERAELLNVKEEIFRSARLLIVTTDLDGLVTGFSQEAERITGLRAAHVVGAATPTAWHLAEEVRAVARELSEEYRVPVEPGFESFVFKARRGHFDERIWTMTNLRGERSSVLLTVTALRNAHGAIYGFMGIGKDITDELRARAEVDAERLRSAHGSKLAALGEMAGGIAHEVNNPLAIIQLASMQLKELMQEKVIDQERMMLLAGSIERTTERIAKIVKGLRSFSREGSSDPFVEVSVAAIANDTISFCAERFRNEGVDLRIDPIPDSLTVLGRGAQISQVLLNLLNNASDALAETPEQWIRVSVREFGPNVEIRVADSGSGVSPEIAKRIFEPFFTTKEVGRGTGMGLSISLGIAKAHGGDLVLERSRPTEFLLKLPKA